MQDYRHKTTERFLHQRKTRIATAVEKILPLKVSGLGIGLDNHYRGLNGCITPNHYTKVGQLNLIDRPMSDRPMTLNSRNKMFKQHKLFNIIGFVYGDITYIYVNNLKLYVMDKEYHIIKKETRTNIDLWEYSFEYQNELKEEF